MVITNNVILYVKLSRRNGSMTQGVYEVPSLLSCVAQLVSTDLIDLQNNP